MRRWGPPFWRGDATPFHALNRGKRSVAVDLKNPDQLSLDNHGNGAVSQALCRALGKPQLAEDKKFISYRSNSSL
ncbi:MAG: CoA transferase [Betaproteobacteria bacterium]|nr:CoA transferase [Betaproteobacteria bacterium]